MNSIPDYFQDFKNVKCLHISDALQGAGFREGTHLAIGGGSVDFDKVLGGFADTPNLYSVLEIKAANKDIAESLRSLRTCLRADG